MDLTLLKTFLTVSKTQHFGRAADELFITQSAVSARIRLLESQLGHMLFLRNKKSVQLTQEGQLFTQYAKAMLEQWQQAKQSLQHIKPNNLALNILAPNLLWQSGLYAMSTKLAHSQNLQGYTPEQLPLLTQQKTAQLLIAEHSETIKLYQQHFADIPLRAVCAKQHRSQELQYLHLPWSHKFNQFVAKQSFYQVNGCHSNQLAVVKHLLINNPSFTYLPMTIKLQSEHLTLVELTEKPPFTLSLTGYFSYDSQHDERYQAAFSALQQGISCSGNK